VLVVQPSLPVHSVTDLIKLAKDNKLAFATSGAGSPAHLQTELFKSMTGVDVTPVPYKGSAPAMTDFLSGQIPAMFVDLPPSLPLIKDGKMRALGVTSKTRAAAAPEIPPIAEAGVPGFDAAGWLLFAAPANTPKDIVAKLHAELAAVAALPEIKRQVFGVGLTPIDTPTVDKLQVYVAAEIERWGNIIRAAGIAGSE
jgi:tripartite-type tricarboxylate transporter receptor subunit TctC